MTAPAGWRLVIDTDGAVTSTVHAVTALVPRLPAVSMAKISMRWAPSLRLPDETGELQGKSAFPSRRQVTCVPGSLVKATLTVRELTTSPAGVRLVIATTGATVSTVHEVEAALPWLPAASTATTWKL